MHAVSTPSLPQATPDHWNNLLWALRSPDITQNTALPWLPESRRQRLHDYFSTAGSRKYLRPLLLQSIEANASRRLGIYFENLFAFAFEYHPDYALIARNLPLRNQGKTLGELDFVVHHLPEDTIEHWELAVKFYLQVGDLWVGPGLKDRLDIKLSHTCDHQLPIIHHSTAQAQLQAEGIHIQRQWTLMPGRLFRALPPAGQQRQAAATSAGDYWWANLTTFLTTFAGTQWHWHQLPKPCWLAPLGSSQGTPEQALTAGARGDHSDEVRTLLQARGPICIAASDHSGELSRGFLVPDDWYSRACQGAHLPPSGA
ncbi:DUF1853 family protein [Microbulbifer sp. CAU 1566]|uniref:DUF1853 family protein n=1 Tax=Microbulbifer sp. CAU 1566 TaxID=2933269 RepID=UPI002002E3A9|nr:DUF1853 family protein [Microbulbifer sp. CAU 1566]MCK7596207.1 DUF1853 family protein [Microbulbifer sp. CAU 1566]